MLVAARHVVIRSRLACAAVALASLAVSHGARAVDATPKDAKDTKDTKDTKVAKDAKASAPPPALLGDAVQASDEQRYCDALFLFNALNQRWPSARALYNAAEVAYAAGDRVRALDLYREAQRMYPDFERRDVVQKRVDDVFKAMVKEGPGTACAERANRCGDWFLQGSELCDDGNGKDGDGCDGNCKPTGCGNGVVTAGESCDDGNTVDGDGCDHTCVVTGCGNGVVTVGEACDDGNHVDNDGCDSNCTATACGNGVKAGAEECDDGNNKDGDGCDQGCVVTSCGNGVVTAGEQCDDGNVVDGDGCDHDCRITRRAAPLPGTLVASLGVLGGIGGVALVSLGVVIGGQHSAAVQKVDKLQAEYASNPQDALAKIDGARLKEQAAYDQWTGVGLPSLGVGALLTIGGVVAAATGVWMALTATEDAVPVQPAVPVPAVPAAPATPAPEQGAP